MAFDWNSVKDPGGVQNNRAQGSTGPGWLQNMNYAVAKGQVVLPGSVPVLSVGDVWQFTSTATTMPFVTGQSYTVTAITLYVYIGGTTGAIIGPDTVTLSGVNTISVDQLITRFTRTSCATSIGPTGNQIPAHV